MVFCESKGSPIAPLGCKNLWIIFVLVGICRPSCLIDDISMFVFQHDLPRGFASFQARQDSRGFAQWNNRFAHDLDLPRRH